MLVMVSNNAKCYVHYLAGKYEGYLGHLYSPGAFKTPQTYLPYALDNGVYSNFIHNTTWDDKAFLAHLEKANSYNQKPLWVVVPDEVGNRDATLKKWDIWYPKIYKEFKIKTAFALQDNMTEKDIPKEADVLFIGGTTKFKRIAIQEFAGKHPHIHVGRINTERWLWYCKRFGVESSDGTGWFRGDPKQTGGLVNFLDHMKNNKPEPAELTESIDREVYKYRNVNSLFDEVDDATDNSL